MSITIQLSRGGDILERLSNGNESNDLATLSEGLKYLREKNNEMLNRVVEKDRLAAKGAANEKRKFEEVEEEEDLMGADEDDK